MSIISIFCKINHWQKNLILINPRISEIDKNQSHVFLWLSTLINFLCCSVISIDFNQKLLKKTNAAWSKNSGQVHIFPLRQVTLSSLCVWARIHTSHLHLYLLEFQHARIFQFCLINLIQHQSIKAEETVCKNTLYISTPKMKPHAYQYFYSTNEPKHCGKSLWRNMHFCGRNLLECHCY